MISFRSLLAGLALLSVSAVAQDDSTPAPRRHKKKAAATQSPTPRAHSSASPSKKKHPSPTPSPDDEETPDQAKASPSPARKKHVSPSPTPDDDATPKPKARPSPSEEPSPSPSPASTPHSAQNATLDPTDLVEFSKQPERVQKVITTALALTKQNLTYLYGSDDPANGGMDCSGFVSYVLRQSGLTDVPRDASGQYAWVRRADLFQSVLSKKKDTFELDELRPGDLLFWTGTYSTEKDPPVTHAMIYLGREKDGRRVMVGSSDGRTYDGVSRWGVSVFDFKPASKPPSGESKTAPLFVGYATIPGLRQ